MAGESKGAGRGRTAGTAGWPRRRVLAALLSAATGPAAWAARHDALPLMLATEAPDDIDPAGYLVSEKYDGVRALWNGRTLRFRSGAVVAAPRGFLDALPSTALDGELWLARGQFEALSGLVRRADADEAAWRDVRYQVFDLPGDPRPFAERAKAIEAIARERPWPAMRAVAQRRIEGRVALRRALDEVVGAGGEGLVLHRADARWHAGRSSDLLKLKPMPDAEAVVVAHEPGQGKYAGALGALRVRLPDGTEFRIGTGFSDAERRNPPPIGSEVTFSYRGTTAGGVPRFASYLRRRREL